MIRQATHDDIPALIEHGRAMHAESKRFARLSFSDVRLAVTLHRAIAEGFAQVVEDDDGRIVGGMLAMVSRHWFSDDLIACDLALFVAPESRGTTAAARLLKAYAKWALESGAKVILFGVMTGIQTDKVAAIAQAVGWRHAGIVMEVEPNVL